MKRLVLKDVLSQIGGELITGSEDLIIYYATISSGMMRNYSIFFDIYGRSYFNPEEFKEYTSPVIVTEDIDYLKPIEDHAIIVKVKNAKEAYFNFARYYRSIFPIPIIGITGTCGKTTTKEMIKHILSNKYNVRATYKSQNAGYLDLHYLLGVNEETDFGVIEMGVLWPGDLIDSCKVLQPQIRVILNVGVYHLTGCKTPEEYIKAKGEMLEGIDEVNGTLILNAEDENIKKIDISRAEKIVYFGIGDSCEFQAKDIKYSNEGMCFNIKHKETMYEVNVPGYGRHTVYNALAALAAVYYAGIDLVEAIKCIATFNPVIEHTEIHQGANGCTIIDDTWSSAPPSVYAALEVLRDLSNSRKKIALLGSMPLLGEDQYASDEYKKVAKKVLEMGVDLLVVSGNMAKDIVLEAQRLGMAQDKIFFSNNGEEIYDKISPFINENAIILLKITHRQMVEPSFVNLKNNLISKQ